MNHEINARKGYNSVFNGQIGQVLQDDSGREYYRRPPGVRAIIPTETGLIIQKEYRPYLDRGWDYRLPGGKVMDTLNDYLRWMNLSSEMPSSHSMLKEIIGAFKNEVKQEAGLIVESFVHYHESESSATVEHELHYFLVKQFKKDAQELQHGEVIEVLELPYKEVWELLLNREFSEDRTRAVLFEYLIKHKSSFIS